MPSPDSFPIPTVNLSFPHQWDANVLSTRPLILPQRHYVYPREVEEVERGALEVMIRPGAARLTQESDPQGPPCAEQFLVTCALGFRDPSVPTGLWSCPKEEELCAVAGGYAYIIDTTAPDRFTMISYRPVLAVRPVPEQGLLLFVGSRSILAWDNQGQAWESEKLSDEGITIAGIENGVLHGLGWEMIADKETPFALDLRSGKRTD